MLTKMLKVIIIWTNFIYSEENKKHHEYNNENEEKEKSLNSSRTGSFKVDGSAEFEKKSN